MSYRPTKFLQMIVRTFTVVYLSVFIVLIILIGIEKAIMKLYQHNNHVFNILASIVGVILLACCIWLLFVKPVRE